MTDRELQEARYREWLTAQGIRFGFDREVPALANRVSKGVRNSTPPVERWHRIVPTIRLLEQVRERFGALTVNSAYRDRLYNAAVGGVGDSLHAQNTAVDFVCATGTPADWFAFLNDLRTAGAFRGGLGLYRTFVHVDTRGTNATWNHT